MSSTEPHRVPGGVVDADGHVVEPRVAWEQVPERHRPRIERDHSGYEHVVVAGKEILAVPLGTLATPGSTFDDTSAFRPLEEAQPGGSDPVARLADMDAEGIDQAVLYPSVGLYAWAIDDPAAAVDVATAYNDWLADYCAADPSRLFGAAMLPVQDPVAAVHELERAAGQLGFKACFVRPNPCLGRSLSDRAYEPIWRAAEETGVAVGVHEGSSVILPTLASDRPFNPLILHAVSHAFEEMLAYAQLACFGVFERHPDLRVVFLESSGGWAPFWLERLDEQAESFGGFCPDMHHRPSEYFDRQCWISFEIDEKTLPALLPFCGRDRVVWGSDYPHHDATFPGAVSTLRHTMRTMSAADQARVLGRNAATLYRLPARHSGDAAVVAGYFDAVTSRDPDEIRALFAPGAVVTNGERVLRGPDEIADFYAANVFVHDDVCPDPGPLERRDGTVVVDLRLRIAGNVVPVTDVFVIDGDRIANLDIKGAFPAP